MISILIMEDQEEKNSAMKSLLVDECNIPEEAIDVAKNIFDGRLLLQEKIYDLLLLDMVLPARADLEPNEDDSPKFIEDIYTNPNIYIPSQIVGETSHDDKFEELKLRFEDKLWTLVQYKNNSNDWKSKIRAKVFHLQRHIQQVETSVSQKSHYDLAIVCALRDEYNALLEVFGKDRWKKCQDSTFPLPYHTCRIATSGIGQEYSVCAVCVGNPGMVQTSIYTTAVCKIFTPKTIFMTGFSAGLKECKLNFGDIVIAKSVQDYSRGKMLDEPTGTVRFLREIHQISVSHRLQYAAEEISSDRGYISDINLQLKDMNLLEDGENVKAVVAPTVCGPFVVASSEIVDDINEMDRNLMALDMEGFGLYAACQAMDVECLWVKGVADYGKPGKGNAYHKLASYASAMFLYKLIKESL